jgi:hypothetical protein
MGNNAKLRPLKRKQVFVPEPTTEMRTIDEIVALLGDPAETGQDARYGKGEEQVERLWDYKSLALEIHESPQATMLSKFNLEYCLKDGKPHRTGGNRSQLAVMYLKHVHGDQPVKVVVESEVDGRPLRLEHEKNYGVKFPVKFYGELAPDQIAELENRDNRAVKKASKADFFFKGWNILKTTTIGAQPNKEKMLVRRMGVGDVLHFFPTRQGLKKDGTPYLPAVTVDEKTGDITINNREAIQTIFRLWELPDDVALKVIAGIAGEGPFIPLRALSAKLIPAWDEDKEKAKEKGVRLNNGMTVEQIAKALPESALAANMAAVTAKKVRGGKKITPYTGAEMKKLEKLCSATTALVEFLKVLQREPSHADDSVLMAVIELVAEGEKKLGPEHPAFAKVFAAIKNVSSKTDTDSDEEDVDVDPETGEPLTGEVTE